MTHAEPSDHPSRLDESAPGEGAGWSRMTRIWSHVRPPLKPQAADTDAMAQAVHRLAERRRGAATPLRIMMLGVTAEVAQMNWPAGAHVTAVDSSPQMISQVWPGTPEGVTGQAVQGDWLDPPAQLRQLDGVITDGGMVLLRFPHDVARLFALIAERLAAGGLFITRSFVLPTERESVDEVFAAMEAGKVSNFHEFKFRVLMALQSSPREGVAVRRAYETILRRTGGHAALAERTGWPVEQIATIEAYRDNDAVYAYASLDDYRTLLRQAGLVERSVSTPTYPMGDRCPLLVYERSG